MKFKPNENVLRVALLVFSITFGILSVALIALGSVYMNEIWWPRHYVALDFIKLPTLLIVLGCVSLVLAVYGGVCSKSSNKKVFYVFIVLLILVMTLQLSIAVISFRNMDKKAENHTRSAMLKQMNLIEDKEKPTFLEIQEHYKCCGLDGIAENCEHYILVNGNKVQRGCVQVVFDEIKSIALQTGSFLTGVLLLQAIETAFAIMILHSIKDLEMVYCG